MGEHTPPPGEAEPLALHSTVPEDPWQVSSSPVTRRLAVVSVSPGVGTLQAAVNAASAGDELVLADGTYTGATACGMACGVERSDIRSKF